MTALWFEASGSGPAVVLVHAGICDARMWDRVWPVLTSSNRVVRCDLRGYGRTGAATEAFAPSDDVIAVLDAAGVDRAVFCGVSYGARVALEAALAHPERASGLVLGCFALDWSTAPDELRDRIREADDAGEGGDVDGAVELELRIWVDGAGRSEPVDPVLREEVRVMNRRAWDLGLASTGEPVPLDPSAAVRLGEVAVPTLVVAGEQDVPFMTRSCRSIAEAIPGARFELMSGVAHLPPLERPDAFAELVREIAARAE